MRVYVADKFIACMHAH